MSKENVPAVVQPAAVPAVYEQGDFADAADALPSGALAVPFLRMLQKGSPQVDPEAGAYVKGAIVSNFFNTVSREFYDSKDGLEVIPIRFDWHYRSWNLRENGGGPRDRFTIAEGVELLKKCQADDKNRQIMPDGTELVETMEWLVMYVNPTNGQLEAAIAAFTKSGLKKCRPWNSQINNLKVKTPDGALVRAKPFVGVYTFKTVREEKDGNSWYNWDITVSGRTAGDVLNEARTFARNVSSGAIQVEATDDAVAKAAGEVERSIDEEVPF